MNRTILIVICDFLLVSLLAFSTVDINKASDEAAARQSQPLEMATNQVPEVGKDLTAVMRLALDDERKSRDLLMGELERSRLAIAERERQVRSTQQEVQSREQQTHQLQEQLQSRELQASQLQEKLQSREQQALQLQDQLLAREKEAQRLAQGQSALQGQFAAAQTNLQALNQRLTSTATEALVSKEKLAAMEAEIRKRAQEAAAMQEQMAMLAKTNQAVLMERQKLAGELQVAEVEKRHAVEQVARISEQVKIERQEKAKLVEGVTVLANKSGELAKEVRENRPLTPNTIFSEFAANRVRARFDAFKPGLIDTSRTRETETVIVTDGTNYIGLCHVADTPLALVTPGVDWESLSGTLVRGAVQVPMRSVSFHVQDPRLVIVPLTPEQVKQLGSKVYRMSSAPSRFQDAVLVGTREAYYGECRFQIDLSTPEYLKLDSSFVRGLFGKFNPSRGDLVFSRTGELLGIMANGNYCFVLQNFEAGAILQFGKDVTRQQTGTLLSLLGARVASMPVKLQ